MISYESRDRLFGIMRYRLENGEAEHGLSGSPETLILDGTTTMTRRPATARFFARLATCGSLVAVAVMVCGLLTAALAQSPGAPKRLPSAKPSDCAACHGKTSPLPQKHPAIANKTMSDCIGCHAKGSPTALRGKLPLSHTHQLSGVTCKSCHANPRKPEAVKAAKCLTCHTGEAIFAATAQVKPTNPHGSPHYGKESDCNLCHHQHEKAENYCTQCHKFDFKVP
jgi:hypothetical protein